MIRYFKALNGEIKDVSKAQLSKNTWIDVISPTDNELKEISQLAKIPIEDLKMPLDEEERSRIEQEKNYTMIIYRSPFIKEDEIETSPIGFFLTKDYFITIHLFHSGYVKELFEPKILKTVTIKSPTDFLHHMLFEITKNYFYVLRQTEKQIDYLEDIVIKEVKNITIEKIASIRKTLIYFHRSLIANRMVLIHMIDKKTGFIDKNCNEKFKDLHTETFQLLEMTVTYRDIITGTMDAYKTIVSNSFNEVMKRFTIIMALFTLPGLVTSLFSMNMKLPLFEPYTYYVVILATMISMIVTYLIFKLKKWV